MSRTDKGMYQCVADASLDGTTAAAGAAPAATSKMTSGQRGPPPGRRRQRRRRTARAAAALELGGNTRDWQVAAVRPLPRYIGSVVIALINGRCRAYGQLLPGMRKEAGAISYILG